MNWMMLLTLFLIAFGAFAIVIVAMAIGVMMGRRQISGSCGGLANSKDKDGNSSCSLCSNPAAACRELTDRMRGERAISEDINAAAVECEKDCEQEGCSKEKIAACKGPREEPLHP
jgi:uncharacterized protein